MKSPLGKIPRVGAKSPLAKIQRVGARSPFGGVVRLIAIQAIPLAQKAQVATSTNHSKTSL